MATKDGVFLLDNGLWGYRFSMIIDGKTIARKKTTDALGNKLKTKKEALKAREAAMMAARLERERKKVISRRTVSEVFEEYREKGRTGKAYKTVLKQDSLWKNHFSEKWGNNWSSYFEKVFILPSESSLSGGKKPKTEWMVTIDKLQKNVGRANFSVAKAQYEMLKEVESSIMPNLS